ncbi:YlbF family regulator [[Clostridium] polysaccharolyticum]|uniref:Control of competence regulator ComK, YlbF/YmcA n=1 Tax=[Clostridium] polysaccharolyticum TaxID=29364 RepID=A0A1H9ZQK7_9FIRM|nr:YlbF family regulator [[Clostridium] polysaccharolyticum]SES83995.1 Control of competence regulator ComK, YlbF/YmcA [[Clostridium] polysaccharolyticum]
MKKVEEATRLLIGQIKESKAYQDYTRLYSEIQKNPELLKRVNEYRKRRFEIHLSNVKDYSNMQEDLRREFSDIHSNELTLEFLIAEKHFSNMMKLVNHTILDSVQMDIDFLGD